MSEYTDKQFEDIIMPWWDNLSLGKKQALTTKYFPRFSVSMMDGEEITEVFEKEINKVLDEESQKHYKSFMNEIEDKFMGIKPKEDE